MRIECSEVVRKMFSEKLNVSVKPEQIAVAHRIACQPGKVRPIIVRLVDHNVKMSVLKKRR